MKYDNPAKKESVKKKISDNNPMKKQEYRDKIKETKKLRYDDENYNNYEKYKQTCLNKYGVDSTSKVKEFNEKRIDTYTRRLSNGDYKIKNNWKCGNYIRNNGEIEWYNSSYELKMMIEYDTKNIIWTKKHKIRISFLNKDGLNSFYVPDFLIDNNGIKSLVEIKGWIKDNDILKANAGIQWCKNNNINYIFILGSEMKINNELSFFIK
jgi:hypothetical protein